MEKVVKVKPPTAITRSAEAAEEGPGQEEEKAENDDDEKL